MRLNKRRSKKALVKYGTKYFYTVIQGFNVTGLFGFREWNYLYHSFLKEKHETREILTRETKVTRFEPDPPQFISLMPKVSFNSVQDTDTPELAHVQTIEIPIWTKSYYLYKEEFYIQDGEEVVLDSWYEEMDQL